MTWIVELTAEQDGTCLEQREAPTRDQAISLAISLMKISDKTMCRIQGEGLAVPIEVRIAPMRDRYRSWDDE